ncbi:hypothetical protein ABE189_17320 [Bacillus subtilis]|uniref:hypothetical protein n=1 Tax=Bacillus subtilis TaxID=1423 RepID=UPI000FF8C07F|nr:hypothetical protein [Bacillus subtilis]QAR96905.1 hypothetical protein EQH88_09755 [Bacillus subtilis]QAW16662.1 hypothetical protein ETA19_09465 [Bacillus subtilis]QAW20754.1 hypothetical protein ETA18_09465 [Bacillus subtilis]UUN82096.1 hypothetical protein KMZ16_09300 [Bacillus subtilis subsp. subtilis]WGT45571.1 hypothetical protein QEP20_09360 [Bacillus subtilis subsp. subtilis]
MVKIIMAFVYLFGFVVLSNWAFDGIFSENYFSPIGFLWSILFTFFTGVYTGLPLIYKKFTQSNRLTFKSKKPIYFTIGTTVILFGLYFLKNEIVPYLMLCGYFLSLASGIALTILLQPKTNNCKTV